MQLALERAPVSALPLRSFGFVPLWGMVAGFLLLSEGPALWASRWTPAAIAVVHAFTLGVLGNAMLGGLEQFLPVAAGVRLRGPWFLVRLLPFGFNAGVAGLLSGMLFWPRLLPLAGFVLACTILGFATRALAGIRFDFRQTALRLGMAFALCFWVAAASLGLGLVLAWSGWLAVPMPQLTDIHAALGIVGAVLLLLGAVGSVVVPMFQGTAPVRPRWLAAWMGVLVAAVLLFAYLRWREVAAPGTIAGLLAIPGASFAIGLGILHVRAPHRRNPTLVGFWRLGALSLLAASIAIAVRAPHLARWIGVLVMGIGLPALVVGMLLEICIFLAWLDLQSQRQRGVRVPSTEALWPEARKRWLLVAHGAVALMGALALAVDAPTMLRALGAVLATAYLATGCELFALRRRVERWRRAHAS